MPVAFQDYYEALGVSRDASQDEIRQAYRRLARRYHPDVNKEAGAEDRFKQISEAYEVLRDPREARALRPARRELEGGSGRVRRRRVRGRLFRRGDGFGDVRVEFGGRRLQRLLRERLRPSRGRGAEPATRASTGSRCAAATTRRCSTSRSRRPRGRQALALARVTGAASRWTSRAGCATASGSGWRGRAAPGSAAGRPAICSCASA